MESTKETIRAIADRIDEEHEKACEDAWNNGYEADYVGIEKWLTEHPQVIEHHGYVELPKDADNVPIQQDDVLVKLLDGKQTDTVVRCDGVTKDFVFHQDPDDDSTEGPLKFICVRASAFVHYHKPTVEDVLHDFAIACEDGGFSGPDMTRLIEEYAKKLRMASEEI